MKKILIVEDDNDIRRITHSFLASKDFEVIQAENGLLGLELAYQNYPDLIICDINMPLLDGYDLRHQLSTNPLTASTPFIFLTGLPDRAIKQAKEKWVNCRFLSKPFTRTELMAEVSHSLSKTTPSDWVA